LSNRITIFKIKKYKTNKVNITINILQELLLSLILFLFYSALLLKKLHNKNIVICDFVNNVILLIKEDNAKVNCEQLIEIYKNVCKK